MKPAGIAGCVPTRNYPSEKPTDTARGTCVLWSPSQHSHLRLALPSFLYSQSPGPVSVPTDRPPTPCFRSLHLLCGWGCGRVLPTHTPCGSSSNSPSQPHLSPRVSSQQTLPERRTRRLVGGRGPTLEPDRPRVGLAFAPGREVTLGKVPVSSL